MLRMSLSQNEDLSKLRIFLMDKREIWLSVPEAFEFWTWFSNDWSAQWLGWVGDEHVLSAFDRWVDKKDAT